MNQDLNYYKELVYRAPIGYALHRMVYAADGSPVDYEFIEVNPLFARILGKEEHELPGLRATEVAPDFLTEFPDWISDCHRVAMGEGAFEKQYHSSYQGRWFQIQVFSTLPGYFTLTLSDITEHMIGQARLSEQTRELEGITEALNRSTIVSITDRRGMIIDVNDAFCEISGFSRQELIGSYHNIINSGYHPREFWKDLWKTINQGHTWRAEVRNRAKDGSYYWVDTTINPMRNAGGQIDRFLSIRNLITDKVEASQRLKESEERYTLATEGAGVGLWDWDMVNDKVQYSRQWKAMLGYALDEIPDSFEGWKNLWHPEDAPIIEQAIHEHMDGITDRYEVIHRLKHRDGTYRWVLTRGQIMRDNKGGPVRWIGTNMDITEQKQTEEQLRDYKRLMDLFFSQSLTGFFFMMLDEPIDWGHATDRDATLDYVFSHQRITRINDAMLVQYRAKREEFIGLTPGDFFAHDLEQGKQVWNQFFDEGRLHIDTKEQRFDGSEMWVVGDYLCMYDEQGRITGHFGIQNDISRRKNAELALQEYSDMQRILMKIASQYINIPLEQVDDAIHQSLQEMAEFVGADRAYIFHYDLVDNTASNTYEWCGPEVQSQISELQNVPLDMLPDWMEAHRRGEDLQINNVEELPEGGLKELLSAQSIRSLVAVPMINHRELMGFVGFDWVSELHDHKEQEVQLLHLFSQMLVNIQNRSYDERELVRLAVTDPLLGIYNRARFMEFLREEIKNNKRYGAPFSLIMFDIDHFKNINDTHGHDVGDLVLKEVVRRVQSVLRETDQFARWGGEEFQVLCKQIDQTDALALADRIRTVVHQSPIEPAGDVSISAGVSQYRQTTDQLDDEEMILKRVDEALYRAKENGRNRVEAG